MKNKEALALVEDCANGLIKIMETGTNPWVKQWRSNGIAMPYNPVSDKEFSNFNAMWLNIVSSMNGYSTCRYITYSQAQSVGGFAKKGSKAVSVLRPLLVDKEVERNGKKVKEKVLIDFIPYKVFNLDQCEGVESLYPVPVIAKEPVKRRLDLDMIMNNTGIPMKYVDGDRCFYSPVADQVTMQPIETFERIEGFYATCFHELGHGTGHEKRLNRFKTVGKYDRAEYAYEELVAELTAATICQMVGIDGHDRHAAAYLQNWIKALKDDKMMILDACKHSGKAVNLIMKGSMSEEIALQKAA